MCRKIRLIDVILYERKLIEKNWIRIFKRI